MRTSKNPALAGLSVSIWSCICIELCNMGRSQNFVVRLCSRAAWAKRELQYSEQRDPFSLSTVGCRVHLTIMIGTTTRALSTEARSMHVDHFPYRGYSVVHVRTLWSAVTTHIANLIEGMTIPGSYKQILLCFFSRKQHEARLCLYHSSLHAEGVHTLMLHSGPNANLLMLYRCASSLFRNISFQTLVGGSMGGGGGLLLCDENARRTKADMGLFQVFLPFSLRARQRKPCGLSR